MADIDLVIFDLDGTLLDTIEDLGDSVNEVLRSRQLPEHSYNDYREYIGDGMEMLIRRALPTEFASDPEVFSAVLEDYQAAYGRNWNNKSGPYEGIPECLESLSRQGVKLAVLSNKPHHFTRLCVSELLPGIAFAEVCGDREGIARKPDPGGALAIADELGAASDRTLFAGDTDVDIFTAVGAGMVPVGVLWGFRSENELREAGARHLVAHPDEIVSLT
ncbi:MAG: HAD family hydrolase [Verrucomicrobiaceae bacterium]|nr:HAD family hydrolase [Verrucomicrobiaceae bacterium]